MNRVAYSNHNCPHTSQVALKPEAKAEDEGPTEECTGGIPPEEEKVDMKKEHMPTQRGNKKSHQTWDWNNPKNNK